MMEQSLIFAAWLVTKTLWLALPCVGLAVATAVAIALMKQRMDVL